MNVIEADARRAGRVKNSATTVTSAATSTPRTTPPATKPSTIVEYASGATSISSRCSISLLEKNDDTTFANEFVITDIMMRPGAMNVMYDTPSIWPIRLPTSLPKMTKYSVIVIAGGTIVCTQMRTTRRDSLRTIVASPIALILTQVRPPRVAAPNGSVVARSFMPDFRCSSCPRRAE